MSYAFHRVQRDAASTYDEDEDGGGGDVSQREIALYPSE